MAGRRLTALQTERSHLIDRLMSRNSGERAKILVRIMDLEDVIEKAAKAEKKNIANKASGKNNFAVRGKAPDFFCR